MIIALLHYLSITFRYLRYNYIIAFTLFTLHWHFMYSNIILVFIYACALLFIGCSFSSFFWFFSCFCYAIVFVFISTTLLSIKSAWNKIYTWHFSKEINKINIRRCFTKVKLNLKLQNIKNWNKLLLLFCKKNKISYIINKTQVQLLENRKQFWWAKIATVK